MGLFSLFSFVVLFSYITLSIHFQGSFDTFCSLFKNSHLPFGSYWSMLKSFSKLRTNLNVLTLWYEDMLADMTGTIETLASFLGYGLTKEQQLAIAEFVKFDDYKQNCQLGNKSMWNEGEGHFIRKGKVGDWKNYMKEEMTQEWDEWIKEEVDRLNLREVYLL